MSPFKVPSGNFHFYLSWPKFSDIAPLHCKDITTYSDIATFHCKGVTTFSDTVAFRCKKHSLLLGILLLLNRITFLL